MKIALIPTRQIAAAITHPRPGWTERAVNCAWQPSLWSSCCPPGARKTSLLCWGCRAQLPLRDDLASSTECRRERGLGTWNSVTGYWARGKGTQKSLQRRLKRGRCESGFIVKAGLFEGGNYLNSHSDQGCPRPPRLAGNSSPRVPPEAPGHVPSPSTFIWPWDKKKDPQSHSPDMIQWVCRERAGLPGTFAG